jgi:hypothetical protein
MRDCFPNSVLLPSIRKPGNGSPLGRAFPDAAFKSLSSLADSFLLFKPNNRSCRLLAESLNLYFAFVSLLITPSLYNRFSHVSDRSSIHSLHIAIDRVVAQR